MKTFGFIQSAISHHLKDPRSKALPACRQAGNPTASPPLAIMTQSLRGWGLGGERRWSEIVVAEAVAKCLKYPKIKFEKEESYEKT